MSSYIQIYRNTNKDITIGNYTHKELALPVLTFLISYFLHYEMLVTSASLIISFYLMIILKEINETKLKGYYKAYLWWIGLVGDDYKTFPKSYEREFWR